VTDGVDGPVMTDGADVTDGADDGTGGAVVVENGAGGAVVVEDGAGVDDTCAGVPPWPVEKL
jgi:hypothetical protein